MSQVSYDVLVSQVSHQVHVSQVSHYGLVSQLYFYHKVTMSQYLNVSHLYFCVCRKEKKYENFRYFWRENSNIWKSIDTNRIEMKIQMRHFLVIF